MKQKLIKKVTRKKPMHKQISIVMDIAREIAKPPKDKYWTERRNNPKMYKYNKAPRLMTFSGGETGQRATNSMEFMAKLMRYREECKRYLN